jgi:DNA topoisomerase-1
MSHVGLVVLEKYTLIVTEKPDAANRIAAALDVNGKARKHFKGGVPYYEAHRDRALIIVPALGHLYTVTGTEKGKCGYPVFDYKWVPRYEAERGASKIRVWLKVISELARNADGFIDACDFDVEGSIIGYTILHYACGGQEQATRRMKYSTLTKEELEESYGQLLPHLDFAQVEAGLARHEVDWLYGINLSRALTAAAKNGSGHYAILSTGRVQGSTLNFLVERDRAISSFIPTPFWSLTAKVVIDGMTLDLEYGKTLQGQQEAEAVMKACKTSEGKISELTINEFEQYPPIPFDLGSLQSEAYRAFRYTPMRTSTAAQHLYLDALISYPRTSSQKLPPAIGYQTILRKLAKNPAYSQQATHLLARPTLKPHEGTKVDSAHPAIYPTGNLPEKPLGPQERNLFDLTVRRFLAVFGEPALVQQIVASVDINGNCFHLNLTRTLREGWLTAYKPYAQTKEDKVPHLTEGQKIDVKRVLLKKNSTRPPPRYNPGSLLAKMEKEGIGTKATRAAIIQTLGDRKYVESTGSFTVSELGVQVTEILSKYCPAVLSPQLTGKLEEQMDEIQQGKQTRQTVLHEAIDILKPILATLKDNEAAIGKQLSQALQKESLAERTVGACPKCNGGKLVILRSKKSGKRFVGCTSYFEGKCSAAFPLPQTGLVKPAGHSCSSCGWPMVNALLKGGRRWKLCLNPNCPSKQTH